MKDLIKYSCYIAAFFINSIIVSSDNIITIFIQKYPYFKKSNLPPQDSATLTKYSKKLQQPDYVYRKITSHSQYTLPEIMCIYAGNMVISSMNGQITFPRQQQNSNMHILITKGIKPAYIIAPATIQHWVIDPNYPAEMYYMELKHDTESTLFYYQTNKIDLPKNNTIPRNTLIFITDPETMFIPQGATITNFGNNITLPTIYIKKGFCFIYNSLYSLAIKQYFENTHISLKQEGETILQLQQPS